MISTHASRDHRGVLTGLIAKEISVMKESEDLALGGQAVIEGVMMRGPEQIAIAVRKPDGAIALRTEPFKSIVKRYKLLNIPILRGGLVLLETLYIGIKALNFSGDIAMSAEKNQNQKNRWNNLWMGLTVVFALGLGMVFFFYLPLVLTEMMGFHSGFWFNLVDGIIRLLFFLAYIYGISFWKEIRRVFEYHGAEHKTIFAYENQKPLVTDSAVPYSTHHPRCGTSFLLIVMLVSIVVFMFLGKPMTIGDRLVRLAFVPLIGGISYELIKLSAKAYKYALFRFFIQPGLWLQRITTKEPDESQLEVALVALKSAIGREPFVGPSKVEVI